MSTCFEDVEKEMIIVVVLKKALINLSVMQKINYWTCKEKCTKTMREVEL